MVLFTKEVLVQLKTLHNIHVNVQHQYYSTAEKPYEQWQIYIQGIVPDGSNGSDGFQTYITCSSKEDAYRMYNDLIQQVVDSAEIDKLNTKLVDEILLGKEQL